MSKKISILPKLQNDWFMFDNTMQVVSKQNTLVSLQICYLLISQVQHVIYLHNTNFRSNQRREEFEYHDIVPLTSDIDFYMSCAYYEAWMGLPYLHVWKENEWITVDV